ncbi:MAG: 50S ribosomal protein L3 [Chitinivibrionales bacterium]|nr:50S ribosomal protein L3 [Chitinivibrionales bacterium]
MQGLIGKKIGMTRMPNKETGALVPVTVIAIGANIVHQVKTVSNDGYSAVQLGFKPIAEKKLNKPQVGHFKKLGTTPTRFVHEFELDNAEEKPVAGQKVSVELFENIKKVDIIGISKGRGFAGTIKRHNFERGRKTHGNANVRERGSSGSNTYPGRVFKGLKMAGHYGAAPRTVRNLDLVGVDKEDELLFVKGAVPGHQNGIVYISKVAAKSKAA